MATINQNWYNLNETRNYPLADTATALDNEGNFLPSNIIADLRVRWPDWAGAYAFIGAVAVSSGAVTVTVLVSTSSGGSTSLYIPIAVISVPISELETERQYPLTSMYPGAFGYIAFGSGTTVNYSGRFSGPSQTLLTARAAKPHPGLPVTSLNRLNDQTALTGLINLAAEAPFSITKDQRTIDGDSKDVVLFSLISETETVARTSRQKNIFQTLAGDCGKRPESGTCGEPAPIEFINAVPPDCNGILRLEFTGCAVAGRTVDLDANSYDNTIIIECVADIDETCDPPFLPLLSDGRLPSEYAPIEPDSPDAPPVDPTGPDSASASFESPVALPYCDNFNSGGADYFHDVGEVSGITGAESAWKEDIEISSPEDICTDESISDSVNSTSSYSTRTETGVTSRNMSVWYYSGGVPAEDNQTIYRTFTTDLKIVTLPGELPSNVTVASVKQNGGILANYRIANNGGKTFWLAQIDTYTNKFGIYYFDGIRLKITQEYDASLILYANAWYRLTLNVTQEQDSNLNQNIMLSSTLLSLDTTPTVSVTIDPVSVPVGTYVDEEEEGESGLAGFHSYRSATQFSSWKVEDNRT